MSDDELKDLSKTTVGLGLDEAVRPAELNLPSNYNVTGTLGRGGMGVVYRAVDETLNREVAIKVLLQTSEDGQMQHRFAREAKALASLDHPNIVKFLAWGIDGNSNPYFVMEFLQGVSLNKEIGGNKKLDPTGFFTVFSQVLAGLKSAHSAGIVHRDIKPSNIIICADNELVKLIDFGIVSYVESVTPASSSTLTKTGTLLGSPSYMSPEQCRGAKVDHLSDIYSLGCVMYEALSGAPPHTADSAMEIMYKHMMEPAKSLLEIASDEASAKLARLVDRCLAKDPLQRPQSATEVIQELDDVYKADLDTSKFFRQVASKPISRTPMFFFVGIVLLIALVFALPYFQKRAAEKLKEANRVLDGDLKLVSSQISENSSSIARLQGLFKNLKANAKEEKSDAAKTIARRLIDLAKLYEQMHDYTAVEKTLRQSMEYSAFIEPTTRPFWMSTAYLEMGKNYAMQNKEDAAYDAYGKGLAEGSMDGSTRPQLAAAHGLISIKKHEFGKTCEDVRSILYVSGYAISIAARLTHSGVPTGLSGGSQTIRIAEAMLKEPVVKESELLPALATLDELWQYFHTQSVPQADVVLQRMEQLVDQLKSDDASTRQAKIKYYGCFSMYDPEPARQAEYGRLLAKIKLETGLPK